MNNKLIHILIIEDEPTQSEILTEILSQENYNISVAEDGAKAIEISKKHFFDILICDYNLPDMNGLKIINSISEFSPESIPILLTGLSSVEIAIKGMRAGIHDYLIKPIEPEELKKTIVNILAEREKFKNHKEKYLKLISGEKVDEGTDFSGMENKPEIVSMESMSEKNSFEKESATENSTNKNDNLAIETIQQQTLSDKSANFGISEDSKKSVTGTKSSKKKITIKKTTTKKRNVRNKKSIEKEIILKDKTEFIPKQNIAEADITLGALPSNNSLQENSSDNISNENIDKKIIPTKNEPANIPEIKKNKIFKIIDKIIKIKKVLLIISFSFFFYF